MSIISNAKEISDLIQKLGNQELYRKILDLQGEIINLTGENHTLKEENQELKRSLKLSKEMTFKQPFYYAEGDQVPFCPKCWEVDKIAVHMMTGTRLEGRTPHYCPHCKTQKWV